MDNIKKASQPDASESTVSEPDPSESTASEGAPSDSIVSVSTASEPVATESTPSEEDKLFNTNPTRLIVAGSLVILLFFGGLGALSVFFPFSGAVMAQGSVKISEEVKTVQHPDGGVVDQILIKEGDRVTKGQVLIRISNPDVIAAIDRLQGQLWAKLAEAARLDAERSFAAEIIWPTELTEGAHLAEAEDVMQREAAVFVSGRSSLEGKVVLYRSQITQLKIQIRENETQLEAHQEITAILQEELEAKKVLLDENYIDKPQVLKFQRDLAEQKGSIGSLGQAILGAEERIQEFNLRIADLRNGYRVQAVTQLSKDKDLIFELRQRIRPMIAARQRLEITAPISGEVMNLKVHSEGSGYIRIGEPLMDIVPLDAHLSIEARIKRDDITHVHIDQDTKVQLLAFNRRTTPPIPGKVVYVSANMVAQNTPQGQTSFYNVRIELDPEELEKSNAYLSPGMPVVCYITTPDRTILGYLLEPILEMMDKALRERG